MKNKFSWKLASSLLLIVLSVVLFSSSTFAAGWNIQNIATNFYVPNSSFVIDTATDTPYICYANPYGSNAYLATRSGNSWINTSLGVIATDVSMVMASDKTLHIAARTNTSNLIYFKYTNPTTISNTTIALNIGTSRYASPNFRSVAIGLYNNNPNDPVFSYYDVPQSALKFAYFNTTWKTLTIETGIPDWTVVPPLGYVGVGYAQSMVVNGSNIYITSSRDRFDWNGATWYMSSQLREASSSSKTTWASSTIASHVVPAGVALFTSPNTQATGIYLQSFPIYAVHQNSSLLNSSGSLVRFSYRQDTGNIYYNNLTTVTNASSAGDGSTATSIPLSAAKDGTGNLGVAFVSAHKAAVLGQPNISNLSYAKQNGGSWIVTTIEAMPMETSASSLLTLAYDSKNRPQIVYFNNVYNTLKLAAWDDAGPVITIDAPALNDKYMGGLSHTIKWRAIDDIGFPSADYITISLATKDATSPTAPWSAFKVIVNALENNPGTIEGSYSWIAPFVSYEAMISIEAVDGAGNRTKISSNKFNIILPFTNIKYVAPSPTGNDGNNGNTPSTAYATLQKAMDNMVSPNGKIILASGVYKGTGNYNIKWKALDGIMIQGDPSGGSIISAEGLGRIITVEVSSPITMEIKDLTLRDGKVTSYYGGAIWAGINVKKLKLTNVNLYNNNAMGGGAICGPTQTPLTLTVEAVNCSFEGNSAGSIGGVTAYVDLRVKDSTFQGNSSVYAGACFYYSTLTATNCAFINNNNLSNSYYGTIVEVGQGPCVIDNSKFIRNGSFVYNNGTYNYNMLFRNSSTIIRNSILHKNGGVYPIAQPISMTMINCTINESPTNWYLMNGGTQNIKNCIFWNCGQFSVNGTGTVQYSIYKGIAGSLTVGSGCSSNGPRFISTDEASPDFLKLDNGSGAIAVGTFDATVPVTDLAGVARSASPRPSLGVYESNKLGLTLIKPNGGELLSGDAYTIQWETNQAAGEPAQINIRLSTDNGATWNTLLTSGTYTGPINSFVWNNYLMASKRCLISIEAIGSPTRGWNVDTSNVTFEIKAKDIYVNSSAGSDTSGDGTQGNPYQTIVNAFNSISPGGIIHLFPGVYAEKVIWPNIEGLTLKADAAGSAAMDTTGNPSSNRRAFYFNVPVSVTLEGIVIQNCSESTNGGAIYMDSLSKSLDLINCTIKNNMTSSGGNVTYGGAVYCANNNIKINVYGCTFDSNRATASSGTVSIPYPPYYTTQYGYANGGVGYQGTWYIVGSMIKNNNITKTGGSYSNLGGAFYNSNVKAVNTLFEANGTNADKGGVGYMATVEAIDCTFINNGNDNADGGVGLGANWDVTNGYFKGNKGKNGGVAWGSIWKVKRSTFIGNGKNAVQGGVAYYYASGTYPGNWTVENSMFVDNGGSSTLGGVAYNSPWTVKNSTFLDNKGTFAVDAPSISWSAYNSIFSGTTTQISNNVYGSFSNCNIEGAQSSSITKTNCISASPNFASVTEYDVRYLRLQGGSPCIDSGDNALASGILTDAAGNPRIINIVDMGAYEYKLVDRMVTLITPMASGLTFEAGDTYDITWSVIDGSNGNISTDYRATLEYTTDNGTIWKPIVLLNSPATPSYSWKITATPSDLSNNYKVRITVTKTGSSPMTDISSSMESTNVFTIRDTTPPSITTSLNRTYMNAAGCVISWNASDEVFGTTTPVSLYLSNDNGSTWNPISDAQNMSAAGSYNYVPAVTGYFPMGQYKIKIAATDSSGNTSDPTVGICIDTEGPTMEVITATVEAKSVDLKFTVKVYDTYYTNYNASIVRVIPGGVIGLTSYTTNSAISATIPMADVTNGDYLVTFEVSDICGNITYETVPVTIAMPSAPSVEVVLVDDNPIQFTVNLGEKPKLKAQIRQYMKDLNMSEAYFIIKKNLNVISKIPATVLQDASDLTLYLISAEPTDLSPGSEYQLLVEVRDNSIPPNVTTWESKSIKVMKVMTVSLKKPKTIPNPFNPRKDGEVAFIYKLSSDMDIVLSVYDMSKRAVWSKTYSAGENGGKAEPAENRVMWDGKNNAGVPVANGVYIFIVRSGSKIVSQGQMLVIY